MYDFSVEKYVCEGSDVMVKNVFSDRVVCKMQKDAKAEEVSILPAESKTFAECVAYLRKELVAYLAVQRSVVEQKEGILASPLCRGCGNVPDLCLCVKEVVADAGSDLGSDRPVALVDETIPPEQGVDAPASEAITPQMKVSIEPMMVGLLAGVSAYSAFAC
jgi:hypothetical protein